MVDLTAMERELAESTGIPASKVKLLKLPRRGKVFLIFKEAVTYTDRSRDKIEEISNRLEEHELFLTNILNNPEVIEWIP